MAFFIFSSTPAPTGFVPAGKYGRPDIFIGLEQIQDPVK
jgi:hypothetical protein